MNGTRRSFRNCFDSTTLSSFLLFIDLQPCCPIFGVLSFYHSYIPNALIRLNGCSIQVVPIIALTHEWVALKYTTAPTAPVPIHSRASIIYHIVKTYPRILYLAPLHYSLIYNGYSQYRRPNNHLRHTWHR